MTTRLFNKLVRDKIPALCGAEGQAPDFYALATETDFLACLLDKLREEAEEMAQEPCAEEAADILEVLLAIGAVKGFSEQDIQRVAKEKREQKGGFAQRLFLKSIRQ
jgi:predicted house-cleaning noncanonical NTP pyrophosphatase (MazG superfamily)